MCPYLYGMGSYVGRIRTPKDVHALILRTCGYVTLHGKRDFACVVKVKDSEKGRSSWIILVVLM